MNEQVAGAELTRSLLSLFRELLQGTPDGEPVWITDGGAASALIGSVADLNAEEASRDIGGNTIAAHAEHMRWALQLVNDWFDGKESRPDWSESWSVSTVSAAEWGRLRTDLAQACATILDNLGHRQRWGAELALQGALASYGHAAYHLGAIRQMRKQLS